MVSDIVLLTLRLHDPSLEAASNISLNVNPHDARASQLFCLKLPVFRIPDVSEPRGETQIAFFLELAASSL